MSITNTSDLGGNSPFLSEAPNHPSPTEFDKYLPWACGQLQCPFEVSVVKATQSEYVSTVASTKKPAKSKNVQAYSNTDSQEMKKDEMVQSLLSEDETLKIYAVHDIQDHLVELKFEKNKEIPRMVFQLIGLIIKYHTYLTSITINLGIDMYSLHEINKFLPISNITDICLDNTYIKEGNYYVLLDNSTSIKRISTARCRITDEIVEMIAARLVYPLPASKTLIILDLSSNNITDDGAKHIAYALRSNRCLSYLNLAGNGLTDIGGGYLLNALTKFQLTSDELVTSRRRLIDHYKQKTEIALKILQELRSNEDKQINRRKLTKPLVTPKKPTKTLGREPSVKEVSDLAFDPVLYEKACNIAENRMGKFRDPFTKNNLETIESNVYCYGNNALCYLNLSFNNLTYPILQNLLKVILTQKVNNRKPVGLLNVCIDGNNLPMTCIEMVKIDSLLQPAFGFDKNAAKKRASAKSSPSIR